LSNDAICLRYHQTVSGKAFFDVGHSLKDQTAGAVFRAFRLQNETLSVVAVCVCDPDRSPV
jgi:hypothetical protein